MTPDPEKIVQLNLNAKSLEGRFFGWRLHWPDMPETFSKLNTLQNLPIYMVSGGSKDTVAYGTLDPEPEAALATFQALPNQALAHYINLNASHEAMSMEPYITVQTNTTDHVGVLEWLLQQRKAECKPARRFGRSLSVHRARRW